MRHGAWRVQVEEESTRTSPFSNSSDLCQWMTHGLVARWATIVSLSNTYGRDCMLNFSEINVTRITSANCIFVYLLYYFKSDLFHPAHLAPHFEKQHTAERFVIIMQQFWTHSGQHCFHKYVPPMILTLFAVLHRETSFLTLYGPSFLHLSEVESESLHMKMKAFPFWDFSLFTKSCYD